MAAAQAPAQLTDLEKLEHCLTVCGLTDNAKKNGVIVKEEIVSLEEFAALRNAKGVQQMIKNLSSRRTGSVYYPTKTIRGMSALVYWLNDRRNRNLPLDHTLWTEAVRKEIEEKMHVEDNKEETNETVGDIKKFVSLEYEESMASFRTYLEQKGLACLASDRVAPTTFVDDEHRRMYEIRLDSVQAKSDNKTAYRHFKQWLVDTPAWAWVEPYDKEQDFRKALFSVDDYFNGPGEVSKREQHAKATLGTIFYKNEDAFGFDRYSTKVMSAMAVLDKNPEEKMSERQKVEFLQKTIKPSDPKLTTHVELLSTNYSTNFNGALQYMSGQVSRIYASVQVNAKSKKRRISQVNTDGNNGGRGGGRFGGRGRGRGRGRENERGRGRGGHYGGRGRGGRHGGRG